MCVVEIDMKKTLVALGSMLASTQLAHVLSPSRNATQASSSSYPSSPNAPHLKRFTVLSYIGDDRRLASTPG